tara:strand:- start:801 stop:965 length:165 start_codon:yes stop_codon:yes gene_type:complete
MDKKEKEKLRYIIWSKQQEFDDEANYDNWSQGWYQGLQFVLEEIEKLKEEEDNG